MHKTNIEWVFHAFNSSSLARRCRWRREKAIPNKHVQRLRSQPGYWRTVSTWLHTWAWPSVCQVFAIRRGSRSF